MSDIIVLTGSGCEDCLQRDAFRSERCKLAKSNTYKEKLYSLLKNVEINSVIVMQNVIDFSINGYIRDGIYVDELRLITVEFRKKKKQMCGVLWNSLRTKCVIMYTNTDDVFWKQKHQSIWHGLESLPFGRISLSSHEYTTRRVLHGPKLVSSPETSAATCVYILYKDEIFKDDVHCLQGLIIPNESIDQHLLVI